MWFQVLVEHSLPDLKMQSLNQRLHFVFVQVVVKFSSTSMMLILSMVANRAEGNRF